jgi:hypothetical protein
MDVARNADYWFGTMGSRVTAANVTGTDSTEPVIHETFVNGAHNPPPSSTSSFIVKDTGNCSPRYMRLSLNQVKIPLTLSLEDYVFP